MPISLAASHTDPIIKSRTYIIRLAHDHCWTTLAMPNLGSKSHTGVITNDAPVNNSHLTNLLYETLLGYLTDYWIYHKKTTLIYCQQIQSMQWKTLLHTKHCTWGSAGAHCLKTIGKLTEVLALWLNSNSLTQTVWNLLLLNLLFIIMWGPNTSKSHKLENMKNLS